MSLPIFLSKQAKFGPWQSFFWSWMANLSKAIKFLVQGNQFFLSKTTILTIGPKQPLYFGLKVAHFFIHGCSCYLPFLHPSSNSCKPLMFLFIKRNFLCALFMHYLLKHIYNCVFPSCAFNLSRKRVS